MAEGVLYSGSDDGLIHASRDGGDTWSRAADLPGVPERSFINDTEASQHDAGTVFAVADAHKTGDYTPYVFVSNDHGSSWASIGGDLPDGTIVWSLQQDHENAELIFLGTERGIFATIDGGAAWTRIGGSPTIAFRDIKIHRRDNDLVGATFGRGFYALDDYSPLREVAAGALAESHLFTVRDAWWYVPNEPMQAKGQPTLGSDSYAAPNPQFGATFTYYLDEVPSTAVSRRHEAEAALREAGEDVPFPGYDQLREESIESDPRVLLAVRDGGGNPVRWVEGKAAQGLHRVTWDLRRPAPDPVDLSTPGFSPPWAGSPLGPLAPPGSYTVELLLVAGGGVRQLGETRQFEVRAVATAPAGTDFTAVAAFQEEVGELMRRIRNAGASMAEVGTKLRFMRAALVETPRASTALFAQLDELEGKLDVLRTRLFGDPIRGRLDEPSTPAIAGRVGRVFGALISARQEATETQRNSLAIAQADFAGFSGDLAAMLGEDVARLEAALEAAGAPYTPGRSR